MDKTCRVIYRKLSESLNKKGYINLNHREVNTKDDLIEIAEIFRNSEYETFRMIYLKDNQIVGLESITSRIPNCVLIFNNKNNSGKVNSERLKYKIQHRMQRLNANGYYMAHNHITGRSKASLDDIKTTEYFAKNIEGFKGHVIIGDDNYSWISFNRIENKAMVENEVPINERDVKNMERKIKNKELNKIKVSSRRELVSLLSLIKNTRDYSVAILTDPKGQVKMILDVPNSFINMNANQVRGFFQNLGVTAGATRVLFATEDEKTFEQSITHQQYGTFKDCIYYEREGKNINVYENADVIRDKELFDSKILVHEDGYYEDGTEKPKKIRILYKEVGKDPEEMIIDNDLKSKQKLVGGLIEVVPFEDALIICNEEGKLLNMPPNLVFDYDYIAGNCFVIGDDYERGDFKSLSQNDIVRFKKFLKDRSFDYEVYLKNMRDGRSSRDRDDYER